MTNKIIIRKMIIQDIDDVHAIEESIFATPWSKSAFRQELTNNVCARYYVAIIDNEVVGFGGVWLIINQAHVTNIGVKPEIRRCGIASSIVKALIKCSFDELEITEMSLDVRRSNYGAQKLYRNFGFCVEGVRKGYYEDTGEDAYVMWNRDTRTFLASN